MLPPEQQSRPGILIWLLAAASVLLPIFGVVAALYGLITGFKGDNWGFAWLAAGLLILVADLMIDVRWKHWLGTSEPDLNRRGDQLIDQVVTVVEPITGGARGTVRAGDTVWAAEGADAATGAKVQVLACRSSVLTVGPV